MAKTQSKKSKRHDMILAALDRNPSMRVKVLSNELNVTSETIRRDLTELEVKGRINRTYGGAVRSSVFEPELAERLKIKVRERQAIAMNAVSLIGDVKSLFVGGGASVVHFARALRNISRPITVITASYGVATELSSNPMIDIMSLPGFFDGREGLVHGPETVAAIARYRAPIAILGASGLDDKGISEAMPAAAEVYGAMTKHAEHTLLLADASKFDQRALVLVANWHKKMHLITDRAPTKKLHSSILASGAAISTVDL